MGRGNVCTFGKCEGLYYIDNDDLCVYRPIGGDADDLKLRRNIPFEDLCLWEYSDVDTEWWEEDVLEEFKSSIRKKFPSFVPCDKWVEREKHAILQNQLFYIALMVSLALGDTQPAHKPAKPVTPTPAEKSTAELEKKLVVAESKLTLLQTMYSELLQQITAR